MAYWQKDVPKTRDTEYQSKFSSNNYNNTLHLFINYMNYCRHSCIQAKERMNMELRVSS
jgi:hypothetical protein